MNNYKNSKTKLMGGILISSVSMCKIVVFSFIFFGFIGCNQDSFQSPREVEYLYAESSALSKVTPDSIQRFATKVEIYANNNPAIQSDPLWREIIENIQSAALGANLTIRITLDTEWEGETTIYFN